MLLRHHAHHEGLLGRAPGHGHHPLVARPQGRHTTLLLCALQGILEVHVLLHHAQELVVELRDVGHLRAQRSLKQPRPLVVRLLWVG